MVDSNQTTDVLISGTAPLRPTSRGFPPFGFTPHLCVKISAASGRRNEKSFVKRIAGLASFSVSAPGNEAPPAGHLYARGKSTWTLQAKRSKPTIG
jgi:hypothetical protein